VPDNPAALQWGTPSRVAVGTLRGSKSDAFHGEDSGYSGKWAGVRMIGATMALAGATLSYSVDFPAGGPNPTPTRLENEVHSGAFSIKAPRYLAWGIGTTRQHAVTQPGGFGGNGKVDTQGWVLGASWRAGENLFVGGGYGRDRARLLGPYFSGEAERAVTMIGAGLRGGGRLIWHLELDTQHREDYRDAFDMIRLPGYDRTRYTAEGILGSWLFGYTGYDIRSKAQPGMKVHGYTGDFGYAPLSGFTLTWRHEHSARDQGSQHLAVEETDLIVLGWQF